MTVPEHELSSVVVLNDFIDPDSRTRTLLTDWELGGIALYDTTEGSKYQKWRMAYVDGDIVVIPDDTQTPVVLFSIPGITEASFTFDSSMNPFVTYVVGGQAWIWWYDTEEATQVHTELPVGAYSPRCALDDKRARLASNADIVLAYMMGSSFYTRESGDRFGVVNNIMSTPDQYEYLMAENVNPDWEMYRIGMGEGNRLLFSWQENYSGSLDPQANEDALASIEAANQVGWIDLTQFRTVTFEEAFGVPLDGQDLTQVIDCEGGIKIPMNPSVVGPVTIAVVDSLDMNYLLMLSTASTGSIYGSLNYQNWEIPLGLNFMGGYDNYLVVASDTGKARLRKMDESPIVPDYGEKIDPQYGWMICNPEMSLSITADLEKIAYPEDGLIAHLDASNPASYPGSGSTWFDLSEGGNNATLVGNPPFNDQIAGGVFEFPGSTSVYAQILGLDLRSAPHTISYVTRYGSGAKGRVLGSGVSGGNWLGGYHGGTSGKYYANGWVYQSALGDETGWKHVTLTGTQSGDLWQLFNNGVALHTANGLGSAGPNGLRLGGDATYPTEFSDCDTGWIVVYDRVLSQAEITRLHDYIKGRFGLA